MIQCTFEEADEKKREAQVEERANHRHVHERGDGGQQCLDDEADGAGLTYEA